MSDFYAAIRLMRQADLVCPICKAAHAHDPVYRPAQVALSVHNFASCAGCGFTWDTRDRP